MSHLAFGILLIHTTLAICAISFYVAGKRRRNWWLLFFSPLVLSGSLLLLAALGIPAKMNVQTASIHASKGHAYQTKIKDRFGLFYLPSSDRSRFKLYENGSKLRPDNASLLIIQELGRGAFFHDGNTIYFSATDNTDPRSNGRKYAAKFKVFLSPVVVSVTAVLLFIISWWPLSKLTRPAMPGLVFVLRWLEASYLESTASLKHEVPLHRVMNYLVVWMAVAIFGTLIVSNVTYPKFEPKQSGSYPLLPRIDYYLANRNRFNVVFFGDSQTHYAVHPLLINKAAGIKGYSLSYPNTYIPLQYAIISDLAPKIPKSTTVVLGVTFQNFQKGTHLPVRTWYPVKPTLALKMWLWRLPETGLFNNLIYFGRLHISLLRAQNCEWIWRIY